MKSPATDRVIYMVTLVALVLAGISAGFFYTWSVTVMNGLNTADPPVAINAMQVVNANIRNAWFGAIFFGAPICILFASLMIASSGQRKAAVLATAAFVAAAIVVTITFTMHVPWNEGLALVSASTERNAAAAVWQEYSSKWTIWNHVRAAMGILALVLMSLAFKSITSPAQ